MSKLEQQQAPKRVKVTLACVICRKKKVKCDGIKPACSRCQSIGNKCEYSDPPKKRGPPKGYVEIIENRAHRIESLLGNQHHHHHSMQQQQQQQQQLQHHHHYNNNQQINKKSFIHVSVVDCNSEKQPKQHLHQHLQHQHQQLQPFNSSIKDNQPINALICLIAAAVDAVRIASNNHSDIVHGSNGTLYDFLMTDNVFFTQEEKHVFNNSKLTDVWTENFFNHFNFMFPILSRPEFIFQLGNNELNPLLKLAVFILGCRFSDQQQERKYEKILYQRLFIQSHDLLSVPDISTVQAIVIMCWYTYMIGDLNTCYSLRHQLVKLLNKLNFGYESTVENIHYTEMKRRAFWVSFVIDQWLAASCTGGERLLSIENSRFDCKLPQLEDNQLFALYYQQKQQTQQNFNCNSSYLSIESALQINSFSEMIKLSKIVSIICQNEKPFIEIESSLTEWLLQLPSYMDYGNKLSNEEPSPISKLYRILYYTVQIMLNSKENNLISASICTTAANSMIHISEQTVELGQKSYLYNIFFLSLTLATSIHLDNAIEKAENASSLYKSMSIIKQVNCTSLSRLEFDNLLDHFLADKCRILLDIYPSPTHSSSSISHQQQPRKRMKRTAYSEEEQESILNSPIPTSVTVNNQQKRNPAAAIIISSSDTLPHYQEAQQQFDLLADIFPIINMMEPIIDIPPQQQQQMQWPTNWVDFFDNQTIESSTTTCSPASYITPSHSPSLSLRLKEEEDRTFDLFSAATAADQNFFTSF